MKNVKLVESKGKRHNIMNEEFIYNIFIMSPSLCSVSTFAFFFSSRLNNNPSLCKLLCSREFSRRIKILSVVKNY